METIHFHAVLPQVFAGRDALQSEIWMQEVHFEKGGIYLIEADSGQGKSTFCSYVIGYRHDYHGKITFDGQDIATNKVSDWVEIRQRHISHLFQELRLFPELTAIENVEIKNKLAGHKHRQDILQWFDVLGITDKVDEKVGKMSFGQQQRVAMIRALAQPFDFILVDEPISHLDDHNSEAMGQLMMEQARRQGAGVIVTSIGKHMDLEYDKVFRL